MTYSDISAYLKASGVDTTKQTSNINSKRIYVKELLADVPPELIIRLADELQIAHTYAVTPVKTTVEATFWEPLHFRLFLSHISAFKKTTSALQSALKRFGISGFVAHEDINPTREWQDEIEAGLASMDALAAILMPGFKESNWTDQEVGVAVGRGVLVIPIIRGLNPYGFIGKYQGLQVNGKKVSEVAEEVLNILLTSEKTRGRMLTCLVDTTLLSSKVEDALEKLNRLEAVSGLPRGYLERLREGASTATVFSEGLALNKLNQMLQANGLPNVAEKIDPFSADNEVPF